MIIKIIIGLLAVIGGIVVGSLILISLDTDDFDDFNH
jgi:hypothetical protein